MAGTSMRDALRQVDRLFREGTLAGLTDDRLLDRFLDQGDEDAFAALVARHGPMVLRACLDALRDPAYAEDAFQATFLTLARRAGSIRGRDHLGGWLRRVARRCALGADADALRRRRRERLAGASTPSAFESPVGAGLDREELGRVIGAEIDRLPELYRRPVVLCLLEGLPRPEAAGRLRVSEGVIRGRLARARALLRARLTHLGVAPAPLAGTRRAGADSPVVPSAWVGAILAAARDVTYRRAAYVGWAWVPARFSAAMLVVACITTLAVGQRGTTPPPEPPATSPLRQRVPEPVLVPRLVAEGPPAEVKPEADSGRTVALHGKVLGPEGRPVAGARLYLVADAWADAVERGASGADGSYRLAVPEETFRRNFGDSSTSPRVQVALIATAEGLGPGWEELRADPRDGKAAMQSEYAYDLHLAADLPIEGRVVDAVGKPVTGAIVTVRRIRAVTNGRWEPIWSGPSGSPRFSSILAITNGGWEPILGALKALDPGFLHSSASHANNWSYPMNSGSWRMLPTVTTDADGRFRIAGLGRDRSIDLGVFGPGIRPTDLNVLTRDDAADLTRAIRARYPRRRHPGGVFVRPQEGPTDAVMVFGPSPMIEVDRWRTVAGVVRDARTGEPMPGVSVGIARGEIAGGHMNTDARGHYRVLAGDIGSPLWVYASFHSHDRYLGAVRKISVAKGPGEIVTDFDIQTGVIVTGRVLEAGTGRPIVSAPPWECHAPGGVGELRAGRVIYFPLSTNGTLRGTPTGLYFEDPAALNVRSLTALIGGDGRFRIAVPPGPGVLLVQAYPGLPWGAEHFPVWKESDGLHRLFPYVPLTARTRDDGAPDGDSGSFPGLAGPIPLATFHAYRVIDPPVDATALDLDLTIPRAPSRLLLFVDPDGRPLRGVTVAGLLAPPLPMTALDGSEAEALALDPAEPRKVIALSKDGRYYARTTVGVGDPQPRTIRLEPAGSASGRLLDASSGRPLAGHQVRVNYLKDKNLAVGPNDNAQVPRVAEPAKTDDDGRFVIPGLIPGLGVSISFQEPPLAVEVYQFDPLRGLVLRDGETRDLGDIRIRTQKPGAEALPKKFQDSLRR